MKKFNTPFLILVMLVALSLTVFGLAPVFTQSATSVPESTCENTKAEESQAIIEAYFAAQNTGDLEAIFAFFSPDIQSWNTPGETEPLTYEMITGFFAGFQEVVPDLEATLLDVIAECDKVAVRFDLSGTQAVEFMGQPAGTPFTDTIITIYRLEDGLIAEVWSY